MAAPVVAVTGMGTVNAIAASVPAFAAALRAGGGTSAGFAWQQRAWDGRARKVLRNNTESTRLSACVVAEALAMSGPLAASPERTGLIVAGNNLHQQYIVDNLRALDRQPSSVNPRYALCYADTNQIGSLTDIFGIRGMSYTVGGASASGNVALLHAWQWLRAGILDACVVVGACTELSPLEQQGFAVLGAASPAGICRPFDVARDGFAWKPGAACLVLERGDAVRRGEAAVLGTVAGAAMVMDGNHSSDCSVDGEARAIAAAMTEAGIGPDAIDYVNAHGTGSALGDDTECAAIHRALGPRAGAVWINATKSMVGHCLTAAGVVEAVATMLQLNGGFIHPNPSLQRPIDPGLKFAGTAAVEARCRTGLSNGFAFGGFNTAVIFECGTSS